jgi:hypothetical protein
LHPDYGKLAARVAVTKLHKETKESFLETASLMFYYIDKNGKNAQLIANDVFSIIQ